MKLLDHIKIAQKHLGAQRLVLFFSGDFCYFSNIIWFRRHSKTVIEELQELKEKGLISSWEKGKKTVEIIPLSLETL